MSDGARQSRELARLATVPRRGRGEKNDEFRVSLDEFEGDRGPSQYVSQRIWWLGRDGDWLPGKQGITVRRGELRQVIEALQRAERILNGEEALTQAAAPERSPRPGTNGAAPELQAEDNGYPF